ncbi:TPA: hypothetical protein MCM60_004942 [Klebsiella pneumoniae]|nr:hypothetical protein P244_0203 [Klebsiella pneumoniae HK787]ALU56881.1 hypothetical protein AU361_07880 [Klebsiella pneumoniae]KKJ39550.1 hypothetical protein T653_00385 [Klebsiella pneumoniae MRSN 3852]MBX8951208.1 hypothetical protein [Escherichia coli]OCN15121.1 hypothetical protein AN662_0211350 [Klebsiella pneumoniae subsp. pneumoniae]CDL23364.1 hypothetical protein [Klebsiella pneumoniae IS53]
MHAPLSPWWLPLLKICQHLSAKNSDIKHFARQNGCRAT